MKKIIAMAEVYFCVAVVSGTAANLNQWTFEQDAAGLILAQATNSGTDHVVFANGGEEFLETDGINSLLCTHTGGGTNGMWSSGVILDADVTDASSGVQYLRCDFRYDLSDSIRECGTVMGLSVVDSSGSHVVGLAVTCDGGEAAAIPAERSTVPLVADFYSTGGISAIVKVDMDSRTMAVWYDLSGSNNFDESNPATNNVPITLTAIDKLRFQATGDFRPAGSTDSAAVDNIRTASTWADIVTPPPLSVPLTVHSLFHDNMVLQRDMDVPVWGRATPDTVVNVKLDGSTVGTTTADAAGRWLMKIGSHANDGGLPHVMLISSSGEPDIQIQNVVFGDVYIAAGQSNMEKAMYGVTAGGVTGYGEELAVADAYPLVRQVAIFRTNSISAWDEPLLRLSWAKCSTSSLANFSAVGYFFAKQIYLKTGVPVGLINASWGGKGIEGFMSPSGIASVPELAGMRQYEEQGGITNLYDIYNAMIAPLIPYGVRGVLWYQGENNGNDSYLYQHKMQALMRGWRQNWGQGDFPFYYVQLPNYTVNAGWVELRDAQVRTLSETNTGMAVTIDVGDDGNIHPVNKTDVGYRLAQWALAADYEQSVVRSGPLYHSAIVEGSQIRIIFDYADAGLVIGQKNSTNAVMEVDGPLQNFSIAGATGSFVGATAVFDKDTVLVSSSNVLNPVYVRYCYANAPTGSNKLYNAAGLPASPFRTDESYRLEVKSGSSSITNGLVPGRQVTITASNSAGKVFDRWIGAASEIDNLNASNATVTMPAHALFLLATYRDESAPVYTLTVNNGFGGGSSKSGSILNIEAAAPSYGKLFDHWTGNTQNVVNVYAFATTLRMPTNDVTVTAVYRTVDNVGDGITDAWRALYFGGDGTTTNSQSCADADPDGDGMSNLREYTAGTSPIDEQSVLRLGGIISGHDMTLSFPVAAGHRYRLESTGSLSTPEWVPVLYNISGDGAQKHVWFDIRAASNGFYRIRLIPE